MIGVMLNSLGRDRFSAWETAARLGFRVVHANAVPEAWLTGAARSAYLDAARASGLEVATLFVGFDGQSYADLPSIRRTVGLTDPRTRPHRLEVARASAGLAQELGATSLTTHLGFPPPEADREAHVALVTDLRQLLDHCAELGLSLHLETGQESAAELRRLIEATDRPNLGVNFDPANFLLYDTDDPLRALHTLAPYLRGVHCKDGLRPLERGTLGREVALGAGGVDFPALLRRLQTLGYTGPLVIEREQSPDPQAEVLVARAFLERELAVLAAPP